MISESGEVIVVTSGKGGVGKTTISAHIGTGLAELGKRVLLVDTDIGLRNLDILLGLENQVVYHLLDAVEEKCSIEQAVIADKRRENLFLLPSAQTRRKEDVSPEQMAALTGELKRQYDYVILDCPAGAEQGFYNAIAGAERAVIVTTPDIAAVRDADRIFGILEENKIRRCDLIINRIHPDLTEKKLMLSKEEIEELIPIDIIGIVPEDDAVLIAAGKGTPLSKDASPAGTAFYNISRRITGEDVPFPVLKSEPEKKKKRFSFFKRKNRQTDL